MNIISNRWCDSIESTTWKDDTNQAVNELPSELINIMSDRGSLTSALRAIANDTFEVRVIAENLGRPFASEATKLNLPEKSQATIREVELMIYETPVVYARSIIPSDLTQRKETGLANLGSKPLGHLLFKDGRMRKSRREFTCVEGIFGRRTPYEYEGGTILVNEFFLDALKKYL